MALSKRTSELGTTADTEQGCPIFTFFQANQTLSGFILELPRFLNAGIEFRIFSKCHADPKNTHLQRRLSPRLTFWKFCSKISVAPQGTW